MKNVLFMRHGKSSWKLDVSDEDRSLLVRGIQDTHLVATALSELQIPIDFVYSSPANRALHTAMICLRTLRDPLTSFKVIPELYDFSGNHVMQFITSLPDVVNTVLLFGHNHAFTYLVNTLGDSYIENVPTAGLVHLKFDVATWQLVKKGVTKQIIFPKHLK